MYNVDFILDNKFKPKLVNTGDVNCSFVPRVGDKLRIPHFVDKDYGGFMWVVNDVLVVYRENYSVVRFEVYVSRVS